MHEYRQTLSKDRESKFTQSTVLERIKHALRTKAKPCKLPNLSRELLEEKLRSVYHIIQKFPHSWRTRPDPNSDRKAEHILSEIENCAHIIGAYIEYYDDQEKRNRKKRAPGDNASKKNDGNFPSRDSYKIVNEAKGRVTNTVRTDRQKICYKKVDDLCRELAVNNPYTLVYLSDDKMGIHEDHIPDRKMRSKERTKFVDAIGSKAFPIGIYKYKMLGRYIDYTVVFKV